MPSCSDTLPFEAPEQFRSHCFDRIRNQSWRAALLSKATLSIAGRAKRTADGDVAQGRQAGERGQAAHLWHARQVQLCHATGQHELRRVIGGSSNRHGEAAIESKPLQARQACQAVQRDGCVGQILE